LRFVVVDLEPASARIEVAESRPSKDPKATVVFRGAAPTGPSPLAARDATPIAPADDPDELERPAPQFTRKQLAWGVGVVLGTVVLIAVIAVAARGGGGKRPVAAVTDAVSRSGADEQFDRAQELIAAGKNETALEQLLAARKQFPDDARLAYLAGKVYFHKTWWNAGLKQFRDALKLDPAFRTDAELIRVVLKAFILSREYPTELASFLRVDIGAAARPYLQETANSHPSQHVRARAAAELRKLP
jgi:hypothetical protein